MPPIRHPVYALTTSELDTRRGALERAIKEISLATSAPDDLRNDLNDVIAEQEQRARIRKLSTRDDGQDHYCVRQESTTELERVKRELRANLGLIYPDSPARVPIQNHLHAIEAELAERADRHHIGGILS